VADRRTVARVPRLDTLTAFAIHLELGADWHRFEKAHRVGSWLGLTPSRTQSGDSDRQSAIPTTGPNPPRRPPVASAVPPCVVARNKTGAGVEVIESPWPSRPAAPRRRV